MSSKQFVCNIIEYRKPQKRIKYVTYDRWYRLNVWLIDYDDSSVANSSHCIYILYYTENVFTGHFVITV